jgi:acetolactate synthase-1/2/3 large subunit
VRKTIDVETVAEAYLTLLAERGIDYLFANGGTDFAPIVEAAAAIQAKATRPALKIVSVGHENVAASMAHGYYLRTGRPAAVMFHVNVGTANGINALANAARDQVPILFTAGRNPISEFGQRGSRDTGIHWGQEMFDQAGMVRELCKWDYELRSGDQLEEVVDRALEIATSEPCGPVYLSLPREVLSAEMQHFSFTAPRRRGTGTQPGPTPQALEQAAALIATSERPLLFARAAGRTDANATALRQFAERFALPVIEYRALTNSLPSNSPNLAGYEPLPLLKDADTVVSIESDVPWIPARQGNPPDETTHVHIGVDPLFARVPIRSYPCDVAVTGAPQIVLPQLAAALDGRMSPEKIAARRAHLTESQTATKAHIAQKIEEVRNSRPIHPIWATHCIAQAKGDEALLVNEYPLISRYAPFSIPRTYYGTPSGGGLGWGLGAAIGMKVAEPDRLVIATLGDGAYMFGNPTAGHQVLRALDLPVLFIIFNNAMWEEVERAALAVFPDGHAARSNRVPVAHLGPPADYQHMMEIYGGYGERVDDPAELPAALQRALHAVTVEKRQALLNLIVGHR